MTTRKTVKLDKIARPGNWRALLKEPRIAVLAESISRDGLIHDVTLRKTKEGYSVLCGRDRLAAMERNGTAAAEFPVVECDDATARRIEIAENLHRRRDDLDVLRAAMAKALEPELSDNMSLNSGPGRPATRRGKAIREAADAAGVSKRTVERALAKVEAPVAKVAAEPVLGMEPQAVALRDAMLAAESRLIVAQSALTVAMGLAEGFAERAASDLNRCRQMAHDVAATVRRAMPESVCVYCKLVEVARKDCGGCKGVGYLTTLTNAPKELIELGEGAGIYVGTKFTKLSELDW